MGNRRKLEWGSPAAVPGVFDTATFDGTGTTTANMPGTGLGTLNITADTHTFSTGAGALTPTQIQILLVRQSKLFLQPESQINYLNLFEVGYEGSSFSYINVHAISVRIEWAY